jgi:CTP synthase
LPRDVHPFFAATQAHPELKSRPTRAHPLFRAFLRAALDYNNAERLPVEIPDAALDVDVDVSLVNGVVVGATSAAP